MTIEYFGGEQAQRVLVTVEAAELDRCGVSFDSMSLADPPTRTLLRRLLGMVTRLGLREKGEKIRVDCAQTVMGGCALLFSPVQEREYVFACADDIIDAHAAGALPEGEVLRQDGHWILRAHRPPEARARQLLGEFCDPRGEDPLSC